MVAWSSLQAWHRSGCFNSASARGLSTATRPSSRSAASTASASRKKEEVKECQCFFVLSPGASKSWLMM